MKRILRSTAFRVAIVFALAVTLTTSLVFGLVYWRFYESNVSSVRSVLQFEIAKALREPIERLKRQLDLRLTQDLRHLDYVGLYGTEGTLTFGNTAPLLAIPADGRTRLMHIRPPQRDAWQNDDMIVVADRRPDGTVLVLGRSLVYVDELERAMLNGFIVALVPVVCLALLMGTIVSLRAFRRLTSIQEAIARVMAGELHIRLPTRGSTDDIDALALAVNQMLDEIDRLIGQIKSVGDNIAHDLRAPLAVMRARLERGLASQSDEELRATMADALVDLERALTTVTALLRISELESGLRRGAFSAVDLVEIGRDIADFFEPLAQAKGLALTMRTKRPVSVLGDRDLLREALANLLDNAIKFTPTGGSITIECGGAADTLIAIADTGPGIGDDERDKIFIRFYRSERTRHVAGIGLGLSMAATIVDLHGFGLRIRNNDPGAILEITDEARRSPNLPA